MWAVSPVWMGPGQTQFTPAPQLDGERSREADHAVLARGVRADPGGGAKAFGRGDVDDAAGAPPQEMRQAGADERGLRRQIDGERARPRRVVVLGLDRD